jgi:acetyltransferase
MGSTEPNPRVTQNPSQCVSSRVLNDGTQVTIRPILPEDEPLMVNFHESLSDRTVYMRYFCSMSFAARTAHERLVRICHSSSESELVLVAEHKKRETGERHILGVGRLNRLQTDGEAEVAVLVSDQYQLKGLGTELVRQLIKAAREKKLRRLVAEMLNDNLAIQSTLRKLGFRLRLVPEDPRSVQAVLEL